MISITQLLQLTPSDVRERARTQCTVEIKSARLVKEDEDQVKHVISKVHATDGTRICQIKFYDPSHPRKGRVWVHCSCPYFLYYLEVALTKRGASSVINSNGKFPRVTNPQTVPYLCKHLFAAAVPAIKVQAKKSNKKISAEALAHVLSRISPLVR